MKLKHIENDKQDGVKELADVHLTQDEALELMVALSTQLAKKDTDIMFTIFADDES